MRVELGSGPAGTWANTLDGTLDRQRVASLEEQLTRSLLMPFQPLAA